MRILELIAGLDIGAAHGGAERFGLGLAREMHRQGADVEVCAFWQRGTALESAWVEMLHDWGVPVFFAARWQGRGRLPAYLGGSRAVARHARVHPYDIVHSHFQFGTLSALWLRTAGGARRAVRTAHVTAEWGVGPAAGLLRAVFNSSLFPLVLDGEAGVSRAVVERLNRRPAARLSRRRAVLIPNAIDLSEYSAPVIDPPRRPGEFRVGSAGRLTAQKDYATLLRAVALAAPALPGLRAVIAGGGEQQEMLVGLANELGISERVVFTGPRAGGLPGGLDLFVLPSRYEGLPTVLLEAAAAGIPAAATDIPGSRELIEDRVSGRLFAPGDAPALAAIILETARDPAPATAWTRQAAAGLPRYSLVTAAQQYLDWLDGLSR